MVLENKTPPSDIRYIFVKLNKLDMDGLFSTKYLTNYSKNQAYISPKKKTHPDAVKKIQTEGASMAEAESK